MGCSCKVSSARRRGGGGGGQPAGEGVTDIYLPLSRGGLWTISISSGPWLVVCPERAPAAAAGRHTGSQRCCITLRGCIPVRPAPRLSR